ncbi:MAG: YggS family pyridoxal phosphate-dependent enzyme [Rhodospirillales bacterium CG15_BIG_FIL_POST_REV_8_21_14_020_66_15]|nr:MAG: YggS family pyridoxal phosphate-dependent enzyme [Rhodospirillales bacterium CG15_BIG_FIL_POST_REV_8_21_14_020_66_15]
MTLSSSVPHNADSDIAANLAEVRARIAAAARAAGRDPRDVTLVAVGKTFGAEHMLPALDAGHRTFGENRVQEAEDKWPALRARFPDLRLHLIGPLQSNKARKAVEIFDVVETVDRPKLAGALARIMAETGRRPDCFIQVNTGAEDRKAGILPEDADAFIARCRDEFRLPVTGLMCIPPVDEEPAMHFQLLAEIARRNGLPHLSMGMSADFEIAVQFGATHVRVGSAIFGARAAPTP